METSLCTRFGQHPLTVIILVYALTCCPVVVDCGIGIIANSSLACTRGQRRDASYRLDCSEVDPTREHKIIVIQRVFYGATLTTRGCDMIAPYENCCEITGSECIFEDDSQLDGYIKTCSNALECTPSSRTLRIPEGACDPDLYPIYSSFTFIEYECLKTASLIDFCDPQRDLQTIGEMYLDSNYIHFNKRLIDTTCSCAVITECDSTLTFTAVDVQLKDDNGVCVEEISFSDVGNSSLASRMTCDESSSVQNDVVFKSETNAAYFKMDIKSIAFHTGTVLIRVTSSKQNDTLRLMCGGNYVALTPQLLERCPVSIATLPSSTSNPGSTISPQSTTKAMPLNETSSISTTLSASTPAPTRKPDENSNPATSTPQPSSSSMNTGTIIAIVLASVAIFVTGILIIVFICNRRKQTGGANGMVTYDPDGLFVDESVSAGSGPSISNVHLENYAYGLTPSHDSYPEVSCPSGSSYTKETKGKSDLPEVKTVIVGSTQSDSFDQVNAVGDNDDSNRYAEISVNDDGSAGKGNAGFEL